MGLLYILLLQVTSDVSKQWHPIYLHSQCFLHSLSCSVPHVVDL